MKNTFVWLLALLCSVSAYAADGSSARHGLPGAHLRPTTASKPPKRLLKAKGYGEHLQPVYYITNIGGRGSSITTHDETVWVVAPGSVRTAMRWVEQDPITITPNNSWFSSYEYRLVNQITKKSVEAELSLGPKVKSSIFIDYIDPRIGFIRLTDGTQWWSDPSSRLYSWQTGQAVLIGENSAWFGRKNILININENNHITTTQQL